VRPSSMALRTFISASSSTALPEVLAVMVKPSRIGTPEVIKVPRVRSESVRRQILRNRRPEPVNTAAFYRSSICTRGCLRICFTPKNRPTPPTRKSTRSPARTNSPCPSRYEWEAARRRPVRQTGWRKSHHPLQQRADDQYRDTDHGDGINQSRLDRRPETHRLST